MSPLLWHVGGMGVGEGDNGGSGGDTLPINWKSTFTLVWFIYCDTLAKL